MITITSTNLNQILKQFYVEATPRQLMKRKTEMATECALEYNSTYHNVSQSGINRHLHVSGGILILSGEGNLKEAMQFFKANIRKI